MLVTNIAGFERIGLAVDLQHDLDDVAHRNVRHVRAVPAAPAQMKTDTLLRQSPDRVVERLDPTCRELSVILDSRLGIDLIPPFGDTRIVELQNDAGVDDRLVFLAHRISAGEEKLL